MNSELNSIGLNKPSDTTVVVAMSGGIDSSTVAADEKAGYKVIGITLKLMMMEKKLQNQNSVVLVKILWMKESCPETWN